jgi:hypothetical protein
LPSDSGISASELTADPDLTEIADGWTTLPDAIKAGILAMVRAARKMLIE